MARIRDTLTYSATNRYALVGGGRVLVRLAAALVKLGKDVVIFAAERHATETVDSTGRSLAEVAGALRVDLRSPADINGDPVFTGLAEAGGIALGFGETWSFTAECVRRFDGRLLDVMGIPLPRYRGGAHYTWMIMSGERRTSIHLQLITEQMRQGLYDDGALVKSRDYEFPASARIPEDYFGFAEQTELAFLLEFVADVDAGRNFALRWPDEARSLYMPRLHTLTNGWIDWTWDAAAIVRFICAFDRPYPGASSRIDGQRVVIRNATLEPQEADFHPFQAGLIYRRTKEGLWVAARGGVVCFQHLSTGEGRDLAASATIVGSRLHTPVADLERAKSFRADYDTHGLVAHGEPVRA